MSLSYKKIDDGDKWVYKSRFKKWQLLLIVFIPILSGYFWLPTISYEIAVVAVLFGIFFSIIHGLSSLPLAMAQKRAMKNGKRVIIEKKDGFDQYSIEK